ncbi:MAG: type II toxin-antitoxin system VapC family toxin [Hormoscilla sp. GM7CHS1pb]|nr:type II toxin-antitoxin system VapC family toxin [Hormoscilla sp. GM7CHS1pb]
MTVVVDSNLIVVLANGDPRGPIVQKHFDEWEEQGIEVHAPKLAYYEIANSLTGLIAAGIFPQERLPEAWNYINKLSITYHLFSGGTRVVEIALSLGRRSAYDAAYLALAETLNAELWTLDGPLYRNAVGRGFPVRLLGASEA